MNTVKIDKMSVSLKSMLNFYELDIDKEIFYKNHKFKPRKKGKFKLFSIKKLPKSPKPPKLPEIKIKTEVKPKLILKSNSEIKNYIFNNIDIEDKELDVNGVDILFKNHNLAVNCIELESHSEGKDFTIDRNYHLNQTNKCLEQGIQLLQIFDGEDLELWLSMIKSRLGLSKRIFARKCTIREVNSSDIKEFLEMNHIQGYIQSKVNIGLFYDDELVSVMTFSMPRFNKKYEYELIRFCSKRNYNIIGAASKLWKYFVNKYNPKSVITYANRRFSKGNVYTALGFTFIEAINPNYFYFKSGELELSSRVKFQKHKLKDKLNTFDENLSEAENMFNNDYRRIYDCGNLKFEWINTKND
jgi:possible homing endonuclease